MVLIIVLYRILRAMYSVFSMLENIQVNPELELAPAYLQYYTRLTTVTQTSVVVTVKK